MSQLFIPQIIPRGLDNLVAVDLITEHIKRQLNERQFNFRWDLLKIDYNGKEIPDNIIILDQTPQLKVSFRYIIKFNCNVNYTFFH